MKPLLKPLIIAIIILLSLKIFGPIPVSLNSIVTNKTNIFSVSGEGSVVAVPDTATINLGITVTKPKVKEAQASANSIINKIQDELKKNGIPEKNIKTENFNLNPSYDWSDRTNQITGYQININLSVKVTDFDKINTVIDLATANGANLVGNLQFSVNEDKLVELQQQAREEAVTKAKQKAQNLAKASGLKLGKLIDVQENSNPVIRPSYAGTALLEKATPSDTNTQISPGEQEIKINLTLSYETL